ncbi:MAG: riboflavin synthase [Polyangiaceae bacterium]|nr:riboflavin synthase [Polyangiaceae bacterium]
MFTGLVESLGSVQEIVRSAVGARLLVGSSIGGLQIGDSIAVSGTCLTVVTRDFEGFSADVSVETLERTTLGGLCKGDAVNLERAATLGSPLGGHLVTGHVDGVARVVRVHAVGDSRRMSFEVPSGLGRYIAEKGSACVDGVSLTVNAVTATTFEVMLIPHTLLVTTLGKLTVGSSVNLEIDLLARYVARWLEFQNGPPTT